MVGAGVTADVDPDPAGGQDLDTVAIQRLGDGTFRCGPQKVVDGLEGHVEVADACRSRGTITSSVYTGSPWARRDLVCSEEPDGPDRNRSRPAAPPVLRRRRTTEQQRAREMVVNELV
jgi:hypothetical protein